MKLFMKLTSTIMLSILLVSTNPEIYANASNVDTTFRYVLDGSDSFKTGAREKENATSCYMYCQTSSGDYVATVWGGHAAAQAYDCSQGYRYYFLAGYKRFMFNNVNERGFEMCLICADPNTSGTVATGLWSPDSVYQSGVRPATDYIR